MQGLDYHPGVDGDVREWYPQAAHYSIYSNNRSVRYSALPSSASVDQHTVGSALPRSASVDQHTVGFALLS